MKTLTEQFEADIQSVLQQVYDIGFCAALDQDKSLDEAAEAGDQKVLQGTRNLMANG